MSAGLGIGTGTPGVASQPSSASAEAKASGTPHASTFATFLSNWQAMLAALGEEDIDAPATGGAGDQNSSAAALTAAAAGKSQSLDTAVAFSGSTATDASQLGLMDPANARNALLQNVTKALPSQSNIEDVKTGLVSGTKSSSTANEAKNNTSTGSKLDKSEVKATAAGQSVAAVIPQAGYQPVNVPAVAAPVSDPSSAGLPIPVTSAQASSEISTADELSGQTIQTSAGAGVMEADSGIEAAASKTVPTELAGQEEEAAFGAPVREGSQTERAHANALSAKNNLSDEHVNLSKNGVPGASEPSDSDSGKIATSSRSIATASGAEPLKGATVASSAPTSPLAAANRSSGDTTSPSDLAPNALQAAPASVTVPADLRGAATNANAERIVGHSQISVSAVAQQQHVQSTAVTGSENLNPALAHDPSGTSGLVNRQDNGIQVSAAAGTGTSVGDTFNALDAESGTPATTWVHASARHAEAGYLDPSLGWVSVRADATSGGVHAALVPGSAEAAQTMGTQLPGLHQFLAEQHGTQATVTIAAPETQHSGAGLDGNSMGQSNTQDQGNRQQSSSGSQPVPETGSWARNTQRTSTETSVQAVPVNSGMRTNGHISLIA